MPVEVSSMIRRSVRKRRPLLVKANEQYVLDFGQKNIDPIRCPTCGMLYHPGEESDEKQHAKYHADFDEGVKWSMKLERPKKYFDDGSRIVAITKDEQKPVIEAVNKLLRLSESDMSTGNDISKLVNRPNTLFLMHIIPNNHIVGYIFVEKIKEANNLIDFDSSQLEIEPVRADCGIIFLWVHPTYRRQKIATQLVDVARSNIRRDIVYRSRVAVCDPTEVAIPFLNAYLLHKRSVKVYQQGIHQESQQNIVMDTTQNESDKNNQQDITPDLNGSN